MCICLNRWNKNLLCKCWGLKGRSCTDRLIAIGIIYSNSFKSWSQGRWTRWRSENFETWRSCTALPWSKWKLAGSSTSMALKRRYSWFSNDKIIWWFSSSLSWSYLNTWNIRNEFGWRRLIHNNSIRWSLGVYFKRRSNKYNYATLQTELGRKSCRSNH